MQITDEIFTRLKKEYDAGATYQELAKKHHVSYGYMRELIVGKRPMEKISIDILLRMFPRASVDLEPSVKVTAENSGVNNGSIIGINHGSVSGEASASVEAFRNAAIAAVMDLDIPADAMVQVLKTIKNLQTQN